MEMEINLYVAVELFLVGQVLKIQEQTFTTSTHIIDAPPLLNYNHCWVVDLSDEVPCQVVFAKGDGFHVVGLNVE